MGRERGVVCVGSVEDNAGVFIIVFGFTVFFFFLPLSWSDIAASPTPTLHLRPDAQSHTEASGRAT